MKKINVKNLLPQIREKAIDLWNNSFEKSKVLLYTALGGIIFTLALFLFATFIGKPLTNYGIKTYYPNHALITEAQFNYQSNERCNFLLKSAGFKNINLHNIDKAGK